MNEGKRVNPSNLAEWRQAVARGVQLAKELEQLTGKRLGWADVFDRAFLYDRFVNTMQNVPVVHLRQLVFDVIRQLKETRVGN